MSPLTRSPSRSSPGHVLDLGCGVGHSYHLLAPRETVGVDISPAALAGQERQTVVADMRELPFADGEFESVLSVQSLEHVPDPERVLAEAARVVKSDGAAVFVTPNRLTLGRPDEIIDPYHYVEFDADELGRLCSERFADVELMGLFGSPRSWRSSTRSGRPSTAPWLAIRCGYGDSSRSGSSNGSTT